MGKPKAAAGGAGRVTTATIDDLTPDPANVRRHAERNVRATDASLVRFGPARSVVIDEKGVVRAGNRTLESARAAGITNVLIVDPEPGQLVAVRRKDWSASEATAYAIADNRTAELAEWDDSALALQLQALQAEDFGLAAVGYDEAEVERIVASLEKPGEADWSQAMDGLPDGDKSPFEAMTFTVTAEQAETVRRAVAAAKDAGDFGPTGNENSNGNALGRIAEAYLA